MKKSKLVSLSFFFVVVVDVVVNFQLYFDGYVRMTDEVEKKHDVRSLGMQGFYSNLLTKNVAMGSDVSNALSAFTAGSARQQQVLEDTDTITNGIKSSSTLPSSDSQSISNNINQSDITGSIHPPKEELRQKQQGISTSAEQEADEKKKKEISKNDVLSAKERYLARKRNIQQISDV
jgi:hypothetical protein